MIGTIEEPIPLELFKSVSDRYLTFEDGLFATHCGEFGLSFEAMPDEIYVAHDGLIYEAVNITPDDNSSRIRIRYQVELTAPRVSTWLSVYASPVFLR